jgi:FkbH-like protein
MVAVPEVPDDEPGLVPGVLAAAGYFESVGLTAEDQDRTAQYRGNRARDAARSEATDLEGYLRGLEMRLVWGRFEPLARARVVQLANKTNQFNLTTHRTSEAEIDAIIADPNAIGLQLRLLDRFGDNGIIGLVIGRLLAPGELTIETWLMSCRVLGRQVEQATLDVLVGQARALGARRLIGRYIPSGRNGMVREHYEKLGFTRLSGSENEGTLWALDLDRYQPVPIPIAVIEGA